jgi:hypothetical protein
VKRADTGSSEEETTAYMTLTLHTAEVQLRRRTWRQISLYRSWKMKIFDEEKRGEFRRRGRAAWTRDL